MPKRQGKLLTFKRPWRLQNRKLFRNVKFTKKNNKKRKWYLTTLWWRLFLYFRLATAEEMKAKKRRASTLIKVSHLFLSNGQTEMPRSIKKSKWTAQLLLSNSQWSLADKEILTVMIGQFPVIVLIQTSKCDWLKLCYHSYPKLTPRSMSILLLFTI